MPSVRPCLKPPWETERPSFSGEKGFKFLSVGEVRVKQKASYFTQHSPFPHKLKLRMAQSQTPREAADDPCTISRTETGISQQFKNQMLCWLPNSGRETDSFQSQHLRKQLLMTLKVFNSICFISHQRIATDLVSCHLFGLKEQMDFRQCSKKL